MQVLSTIISPTIFAEKINLQKLFSDFNIIFSLFCDICDNNVVSCHSTAKLPPG